MERRSKEQTDKDNRSFTITAACTYPKPHHKPKPSHIACAFPMPLLSSSHRSPLLTTVADTSPSSASVVCHPTKKKQKPSVDKKERKEKEREREREREREPLLPTRKIKKTRKIHKTYLNQLLRRRTRDVAIANPVRDDRDVVAELGARARGV